MKKQISKKTYKENTTLKNNYSNSQSNSNGSIIRKRSNIKVIDEHYLFDQNNIPQCKHGPCLLFSNSVGEQWFSCAVFRSSKLCGFRINLSNDETLTNQGKLCQPFVKTLPIEEYGFFRKSFDELIKANVEPFWCKKCFNFVSSTHEHNLKESFINWPSPFQIIEAIQVNSGEAQFWFTNNVLTLISNLIKENGINSILCIGTPILFDWIKKMGLNVFLLDFDDRLSKFYFPNEFARFSMLVCHFYLPEGRENLLKFFRQSGDNFVCICDPPFGVQINPLIRSINILELMFKEIKNSSFNKILFLPYFSSKYLINTKFSMVDYKVTYTNHRDFSKKQKTTVRIFTDIPNKLFKLPKDEGYHFCEICERFIAEKNKHCFKCGFCTSLDGNFYKHCNYCNKCVKKKYIHCKNCVKCHLKERCNEKRK